MEVASIDCPAQRASKSTCIQVQTSIDILRACGAMGALTADVRGLTKARSHNPPPSSEIPFI
jgi:hypothetical protein